MVKRYYASAGDFGSAIFDEAPDGHPSGEWVRYEDYKTLESKLSSALEETETLRMQLAGCGVAAMQNTEDSRKERITPDNPYWSASYGDVCRAVDSEIEQRNRLEQALKDRDEARTTGSVARGNNGILQRKLDALEIYLSDHHGIDAADVIAAYDARIQAFAVERHRFIGGLGNRCQVCGEEDHE